MLLLIAPSTVYQSNVLTIATTMVTKANIPALSAEKNTIFIPNKSSSNKTHTKDTLPDEVVRFPRNIPT